MIFKAGKTKSILGRLDGDLGPVVAFFGKPTELKENEVGTLSVASKVVTGKGTKFTSLKVGDSIAINSETSAREITEITSDTSMKVTGANVTGDKTFKVVEQIYLGNFENGKLKSEAKYAELKASQRGSDPYEKRLTGLSATVTLSLTETTVEILEQLLIGYESTRDNTGKITKVRQKVKLWQNNAKTNFLTLTRLLEDIPSGTKPEDIQEFMSDDPMHTMIFPNATAYPEPEWTFDSETQRVIEIPFLCRSGKIKDEFSLWEKGDVLK